MNWCAHSDLVIHRAHQKVCGHLVCAKRALVRHPRSMEASPRAGRAGNARACRPNVELGRRAGDRATRRSQCAGGRSHPRVGGHTFSLLSTMSPTQEAPGNGGWGTSISTSRSTCPLHNGERGTGRRPHRRDDPDMRGGGRLPPPRDLRVLAGVQRRARWSHGLPEGQHGHQWWCQIGTTT